MLPKIFYPTFRVNLPLTGIEVEMRVMNLREEKVLLIAQESNDVLGLMDAMMLCLENCMKTKGVDLHKLPFVELQYMYLSLRSNSVGNIAKILIPDDTKHWVKYDAIVKIDDVDLKYNPDTDLKILFTEDTGMVMRYPRFQDSYKINQAKDDSEKIMIFIRMCVETVFDSENVYPEGSFSDQELMEFIDNLPSTQYDKIAKFIDNIPRIEYRIEYTTSDGEHRKLVLRSLENFIE